MFLSCREAHRALADGLEGEDVLRRAKNVGAFAGSTRTNLVAMLDGVGVPEMLGITSSSQLFAERSDLLHATSALLYPVFLRGKSYGGTPNPLSSPLLRALVEQVFASELAMVPDAFVVPLGSAVARLLRSQAKRGVLAAKRCLFDFPHPSGGNGHRAAQYRARRDLMSVHVSEWATNQRHEPLTPASA